MIRLANKLRGTQPPHLEEIVMTENATTEEQGHVAADCPNERLVMRNPPRLGVSTLCRLMDDCLPEQVEDERDMQQLIDKLWPALCCEFEVDA